MPHFLQEKHARRLNELVENELTTFPDAMKRFGYSRNGLQYAINAGNVAAFQVGRIWLVSVPSLQAYTNRPRYRRAAA